MRVQGEYLFESFEEAKKYVTGITNYEKKKGITIVKESIHDLAEDFKAVIFEKSDNTNSLYLFFKNSIKQEVWKFWCPSERQIERFVEIYYVYRELNDNNFKRKKWHSPK